MGKSWRRGPRLARELIDEAPWVTYPGCAPTAISTRPSGEWRDSYLTALPVDSYFDSEPWQRYFRCPGGMWLVMGHLLVDGHHNSIKALAPGIRILFERELSRAPKRFPPQEF